MPATVVPAFEAIDEILQSPHPEAALDHLLREFESARDYSSMFETRLMKKRHELGLPLIQTGEIGSAEYQEEVVRAARDTGTLFLADNRIDRAWPYFRAIGETAAVRAAIETAQPTGDYADQVASIAFQEGVHPGKGLEIILAQHGMCRAITAFGMTAVREDREKCIELLANHLHYEIVRRLRDAIEGREGAAPADATLAELMTGRDWLFGEWDYYVDTSHLLSVVPYCLEISEPRLLERFAAICEYGSKLAPQFQQPGIAPFEEQFTAYGHYIKALLGDDADAHVEYFREKAATADPDVAGDAPARALVKLLIALGRQEDALAVLLGGVYEDAPYGMPVPTALQLCYSAKNFEVLKQLARERGDLLSYTAGAILAKDAVSKDEVKPSPALFH